MMTAEQPTNPHIYVIIASKKRWNYPSISYTVIVSWLVLTLLILVEYPLLLGNNPTRVACTCCIQNWEFRA